MAQINILRHSHTFPTLVEHFCDTFQELYGLTLKVRNDFAHERSEDKVLKELSNESGRHAENTQQKVRNCLRRKSKKKSEVFRRVAFYKKKSRPSSLHENRIRRPIYFIYYRTLQENQTYIPKPEFGSQQ